MEYPKEFDDIRPFFDSEVHDKMKDLIKEPGFEHAVRYVLRDINYEQLCQELLTIDKKKDFQLFIMKVFLEGLTKKTTKGVTGENFGVLDKSKSYTFMSNHRDIVLDASLLNLLLILNGFDTSEIAIGNNLLIYDWISDLVRLNKSFIVKRDVGMRQMLDAARQLSGYIHFIITQKHESVWIAQREGRSKDSDDRTQESLIKMLGISGEGDLINNLKEINIVPVSISYEYDPCDYLKAHEFLLKRDNPDFKKSQRDDLHSMEIGLLGFKGRERGGHRKGHLLLRRYHRNAPSSRGSTVCGGSKRVDSHRQPVAQSRADHMERQPENQKHDQKKHRSRKVLVREHTVDFHTPDVFSALLTFFNRFFAHLLYKGIPHVG